jgi:hypothetical protein
MLQAAVEAEVDAFLAEHSGRRDQSGRRLVVRNGRLPARAILTGAGPLEVQQPRVRDCSPAELAGSLFLLPSAALPAPQPGDRRADSLALPPGGLHGRFHAGPGGAGGRASQGVKSQRGGASQGAMVTRTPKNGDGATSWAGNASPSGRTGSTSTSAWKMRPISGNACW